MKLTDKQKRLIINALMHVEDDNLDEIGKVTKTIDELNTVIALLCDSSVQYENQLRSVFSGE